MPYSTANGIKLYYEIFGAGLPMVMIHANPFDHNLWMYQIAHFSTYFKVIALDIRGYGRSDKPTTPFSLRDMADDVVGVCRDEHPPPTRISALHISGWSSPSDQICRERLHAPCL